MMKHALAAALLIFLYGCASQQPVYSIGQIKTPMGDILVWLFDETPRHKQAFIDLANEGYWDEYTFNRVIHQFVAQGGCPDTPEGFAYSIHLLEPEYHADIRHVYGAFGAGRDNNPGKLSAACQFYIVHNKDGIARLDDNYVIYGQVIKGMDIIDAIVVVETDDRDEPLTPITLDVDVIEMTEADFDGMGIEIPTLPN